MTAGRPDEPTDPGAPGSEASGKEPIPPTANPRDWGQQLVDNPNRNVLAESPDSIAARSAPRHSHAFQTKAEADQFYNQLGQALVGNLNRNVLAEATAMEPGADWSAWTLGERRFRVSPDRKDARELGADGYWMYVIAEFVVTRAKPGEPDPQLRLDLGCRDH